MTTLPFAETCEIDGNFVHCVRLPHLEQPLCHDRVLEALAHLRRAQPANSLWPQCAALQRGVLELIERMVSHIQKETMALLPMLDDLLDEETDRELAFAYAAG